MHVAAALRTLVDGHQRGVHVGGGRPERHWASIWPVDGELLIERDEPGRPGQGNDEWRAPLTRLRLRAAPRTSCFGASVRRRADTAPLFIQLLDHDE